MCNTFRFDILSHSKSVDVVLVYSFTTPQKLHTLSDAGIKTGQDSDIGSSMYNKLQIDK